MLSSRKSCLLFLNCETLTPANYYFETSFLIWIYIPKSHDLKLVSLSDLQRKIINRRNELRKEIKK